MLWANPKTAALGSGAWMDAKAWFRSLGADWNVWMWKLEPSERRLMIAQWGLSASALLLMILIVGSRALDAAGFGAGWQWVMEAVSFLPWFISGLLWMAIGAFGSAFGLLQAHFLMDALSRGDWVLNGQKRRAMMQRWESIGQEAYRRQEARCLKRVQACSQSKKRGSARI